MKLLARGITFCQRAAILGTLVLPIEQPRGSGMSPEIASKRLDARYRCPVPALVAALNSLQLPTSSDELSCGKAHTQPGTL